MSLFTFLIAVLCVALLVHGFDATECVAESDVSLQPTTSVLEALLQVGNNEHPRTYAIPGISRRSPPSDSTAFSEEGDLIGSSIGSGNLNKRQVSMLQFEQRQSTHPDVPGRGGVRIQHTFPYVPDRCLVVLPHTPFVCHTASLKFFPALNGF